MLTNSFKKPDFNDFIIEQKDRVVEKESRRKNNVNIQLAFPNSDTRSSVEEFIWDGFNKYYRANVQHYLPNLIYVEAMSKIRSAMGIRAASNGPLFIEKYINAAIESCFSDEAIARDEIAEIGNLHGTNKLFTQQLFIVTALATAKAGFSKLVFCATPQVKTMMESLLMTTVNIGEADPKRLGNEAEHWGNYYESSPKLIAIDIDQALFLIDRSERYTKVSKTFAPVINDIALNLIR